MSDSNVEEFDSLRSALGLTSRATPILKAEPTNMQNGALNARSIDANESLFHNIEGFEEGVTVQPVFEPLFLLNAAQTNNTLLQCITAMEVNIDGTGYEIELKSGEEPSEEQKAVIDNEIKPFFDSPYPNQSFTSMRRRLRRDIETVGHGFLEVIRDDQGEITLLHWLDAKFMRLTKLDDPAPVKRRMLRGGNEIEHIVMERERRYVMASGTKTIYFKQFGSPRDLDSRDGKWVYPGSTPQDQRYGDHKTRVENQDGSSNVPDHCLASEVIMFKLIDDVLTPYGVPRWINQMPSVIGSREAEEYNIEFFNHGGLPPVLIMVQGGSMDEQTRADLTGYLSSKAQNKQRGMVIELFSNSGDISASQNVKVSVERFGTERQQDAMFQKYDENTAMHIRTAFRISPMFLGMSEDYNFATAYVSYMVAERQVFQPEREEFDEIINNHIMMELWPDYCYRSKALTIKDVEQLLKSLELAKDSVSRESWVEALNEISQLNLVYEDELELDTEDPDQQQNIFEQQAIDEVEKAFRLDPENRKMLAFDENNVIKSIHDDILTELAEDWANNITGAEIFTDASIRAMDSLIKSMEPAVRKLFYNQVATKIQTSGHDPEGFSELMGLASSCDC